MFNQLNLSSNCLSSFWYYTTLMQIVLLYSDCSGSQFFFKVLNFMDQDTEEFDFCGNKYFW